MQRVLVVDAERKPLMPCHPARARQLLREGRAAVLRRYPFTIILKDRTGGETQPIEVKIDPGSRATGIALVAEFKQGKTAVWGAELQHRGQQIKNALDSRRSLRRSRRSRKTRYRAPRFDNRTRPQGWLPPSLMARVHNIKTWAGRLTKCAPISSIAVETARFDTQALQNPEISGAQYQQGTLFGYEVREYLLEKWGRKCAYCGKTGVPLEVEHIVPKIRGGSDRVSNLTLACRSCNQKKGSRTAAEFGFPQIQEQARKPLRDAAALNATRYAVGSMLKRCNLPVSFWSGGRTKYNRIEQGYPKEHWIDAACVGESGEQVRLDPDAPVLAIRAVGHGTRQMCGTDKHGFPKRHRTRQKRFFGFQTGDIVQAVVPRGKFAGIHTGRLAVRANGSFLLSTSAGRMDGIHHRFITLLHRKDGYAYG
jgi:5-methylcytosine-specific restriction endonuclease McrA